MFSICMSLGVGEVGKGRGEIASSTYDNGQILLASKRSEQDTIQWCQIENRGYLFIYYVWTYMCHFSLTLFFFVR